MESEEDSKEILCKCGKRALQLRVGNYSSSSYCSECIAILTPSQIKPTVLRKLQDEELMEWRKPSVEITKHRYVVAMFLYENEDGEERKKIDIFHYNGITGFFNQHNCSISIKYDKIVKWIPIPT